MSPFTNTPFAMPTPSIALLFSLAFALSNALPWSGPQETGVYRADEFSPRPTGSPDYEGQIFKRDSVAVNVCGWVGGRPENVARCGSGSSCVHDTIHRFIGCCATAGPCTDGVFTTCIDQGNAEWKAEGGLINNGVLSWCVVCLPHTTRYHTNNLQPIFLDMLSEYLSWRLQTIYLWRFEPRRRSTDYIRWTTKGHAIANRVYRCQLCANFTTSYSNCAIQRTSYGSSCRKWRC